MREDKTLSVLIAEDSQNDTFLIVRALRRGGFEPCYHRVQTRAAMKAALDEGAWDVVISDYSIPGFGGPAALELFRRRGLDAPFIVVSGVMGEERAVEMIKSGAHYYLMKEHLNRLGKVVQHELRAAEQRRICRHIESGASYLASLVQSCDDAIIGKTLDGTVASWNAGAEKLYGYTADEIVGRSISVLFPPYRPQELPEILDKIRNGEPVSRLETVRIRKDRAPIDVSLTISPVKDAGGRVIGASTVARDITQRKDEENLRLALIQELIAALPQACAEVPPPADSVQSADWQSQAS